MSNIKSNLISIVTATYNAADLLPRLISSLRCQTCKNFEWVVADGGSTDNTMALLEQVEGIRIVIDARSDFGIYDALNRAIYLSSGDYYVVAGSDDFFYENAIENFYFEINNHDPKILSAKVSCGGRVRKIYPMPSIFGHAAYVYSHVVSTAFRKDLHNEFGYYLKKYPIAADQFFILNVCKNGVSVINSNFVAGEVGDSGISSVDFLGNATELFRVQVELGRSLFVQSIWLLLRIFYSAFRVRRL